MTHYPVPQNIVLRAAVRARRPKLLGKLHHLVFQAGQEFWTADKPIPYALFPLRGSISLQISPSDGKHAEVGVVGREGFAGVSLLLGVERASTAAVAHTAGEALLMEPETFRKYLSSAVFRTAAERYTHLYMVMLGQLSICNRVHVIEKICVGRLLLMQAQMRADSFQVTQDFFARLLGVRRASVSRAAVRLQNEGLILYERGRVTIPDRKRLEAIACSCYREIIREFDRFVEAQGGW